MNKHCKAIDLIDQEITNLTKLIDYYFLLNGKWPNVTDAITTSRGAIAELKQSREVLTGEGND